jgi:hypothetical protein
MILAFLLEEIELMRNSEEDKKVKRIAKLWKKKLEAGVPKQKGSRKSTRQTGPAGDTADTTLVPDTIRADTISEARSTMASSGDTAETGGDVTETDHAADAGDAAPAGGAAIVDEKAARFECTAASTCHYK